MTMKIPNHDAFVLIGADAPVAWLAKLGVPFVSRPHAHAFGATDALVESMVATVDECPNDATAAVARVHNRDASAVPLSRRRPGLTTASVVASIRAVGERIRDSAVAVLPDRATVAADGLNAEPRRLHRRPTMEISVVGDAIEVLDVEDFDDQPTAVYDPETALSSNWCAAPHSLRVASKC